MPILQPVFSKKIKKTPYGTLRASKHVNNATRERGDNQTYGYLTGMDFLKKFLETMTFIKTKYGVRHIVDFHKAPLKLTEC